MRPGVTSGAGLLSNKQLAPHLLSAALLTPCVLAAVPAAGTMSVGAGQGDCTAHLQTETSGTYDSLRPRAREHAKKATCMRCGERETVRYLQGD